jgi:phosphatidylglycerophosphatase C
MPIKTFAVFDFDNTITDRDSLVPFLFFMKGFWNTIFHLTMLLPIFLGYVLGMVSRQKTKEKILSRFLKGLSWTELQALGRKYAAQQLDRYVKPEALKRIAWHQAQGHPCILVSASVEFYLIPWAQKHHFAAVIASQLELHEGHVTGRLAGKNCWGEEKKRRLLAYLKSIDAQECELYVYGDSQGDRDILAMAQHPYYRTWN